MAELVRLDEDGDEVPGWKAEGSVEYRRLEVCVPNVGFLGAIEKLFLSKQEASVWEDHIQTGRLLGDGFWFGSKHFRLVKESVSGRYGPTLTIAALCDDTSNIPVFQEVTVSHSSGFGFLRCHPHAQFTRRGREICVDTSEVFSWGIFRKLDATSIADRWLAGYVFVRKDLPEEVQTELIAALVVVGLS